jgi:hypothetical protein
LSQNLVALDSSDSCAQKWTFSGHFCDIHYFVLSLLFRCFALQSAIEQVPEYDEKELAKIKDARKVKK